MERPNRPSASQTEAAAATLEQAGKEAEAVQRLCQAALDALKFPDDRAEVTATGPVYFAGAGRQLGAIAGWLVIVTREIDKAGTLITVAVPVTGMLPGNYRFEQAVKQGLNLARRLP